MEPERLELHDTCVLKRYPRDVLLISDADLADRIAQIERLSIALKHLPETTFSWDEEGALLIYRQQRVAELPLWSLPSADAERLLVALGETVQAMGEAGLAHGDIHPKNLIYDGEQLWLVDLEPALRQHRGYKDRMLFSPPYVSIEDLRAECITPETDRVGFFYTCWQLFHGPLAFRAMSSLMERRRDEGVDIGPISEAELLSLSWVELVAAARRRENPR